MKFRNTERDYRGEMDGGGTAKRHGQYSFLVQGNTFSVEKFRIGNATATGSGLTANGAGAQACTVVQQK